MKLKTLNDFIEDDEEEVESLSVGNYEGLKYFQGRLDLINELKAEAIKWVKYNEKEGIEDYTRINRWIKHFFNIKEEDLK